MHRGITFSKNKHPRISESYLEILVPKSKMDQHRERHIVYISRVSSESCSVKSLQKIFAKDKTIKFKGCITEITVNHEKYDLHGSSCS